MPDKTKQRMVAAEFVEYLEPGFNGLGVPTKVRRIAYRGEVIAVSPSVEARLDAHGSLTDASWPLDERGRQMIERAIAHKRGEYIAARSVGGAVEETMAV